MRKINPLYIFLSALGLYLFSASGYLDATDAEPSLDTAKALWERGTTKVFPGPQNTYFTFLYPETGPDTFFYARSPEKGWYSKMGLTLPLLYLPAVAMGPWLSHWTGEPERSIRFLASLVNPLLSAVLVTLVFIFFIESGKTFQEAAFLSFFTGFATLLFPYAKMSHRETCQALCLCGAFVATSIAQKRKRNLDFMLAGLFLAAGFLTKQAFAVPAFFAGLLTLFCAFQTKSPPRALLFFMLPMLLGILAWGAFAKMAFGSFVSSGYSEAVASGSSRVWQTPFWEGIYAQLISWDSGLIFYSPLVLLPLGSLGYVIYRGKVKPFEIMVWLSFLAQAAFYARWISPIGKEALGSRYLVVVIPVLMLTLRQLPSWTQWSLLPRYFAAAIVAWSLVIQVVNVSVKPQLYWQLVFEARPSVAPAHWILNLRLFRHKLQSRDERYELSHLGFHSEKVVDLNRVPTVVGFNYWWLHLWRFRHQPATHAKSDSLPESEPIGQVHGPGQRNRTQDGEKS